MKSHVSDLTELAACIFKDAAAKCSTNKPDYERDLQTLRSRVEHEGISFLTITLPAFGKSFDKCLASGFLDPALFRSFKKRGRAPAFMRGFLDLVFDSGTGGILNEPEVTAIEGVRQCTNAFKKLKLPCSPSRVAKAFSKFEEGEQDLGEPIDPEHITYFSSVCSVLWDSVLRAGDYPVHSLLPKHGPGSTAERTMGNQKYAFKRWHDRLEPYFPMLEYAFSNEDAYDSIEFQEVSIIQEADEQPVRVITVPKTLKSPRIIAIEPVCMQYTQQALARLLINSLETTAPTRGHINFKDQSVNRRLALVSSETETMATLDLSSASDRVPLSLALIMFERFPDLRDALLACRSTRAQLPDGTTLSLKKFASMGSALCFPVEAMYFYTICVGALIEKHKLPVTRESVLAMGKRVYVYGDDIIVPTDDVDVVVDHLQRYYCKVNTSKSFWSGKFRESCGVDAFDGVEVTPTYVREVRPDSKRAASAIVSWVATSNLFYKKGYWATASHMISVCESILGELPIVGPESAGLGKLSYQRAVSIERWGRRYQRPEVRAWVAAPVYRTDTLEGQGALLKCLLSLEEKQLDPASAKDEKHLCRTARHGAVALKRRWIEPY